MSTPAKVAIIGAGPYGLSLASHLRARGVPFNIFGRVMETWQEKMVEGMFLKSDGFASNLSDPEGRFTLKSYCAQHGIGYRDLGVPIPRRVFADYALEFQRRLVPNVDDGVVVSLARVNGGFTLGLSDGREVTASVVVVAVGLGYFKQIPAPLATLSPDHLSHSADHKRVDCFRQRDVIVLGGGASAMDLAIQLHEHGSNVRVVARTPEIRFQDRIVEPRTLWRRARRPASPIGLGWRSQIISDAPMLFHFLPESVRLRTVQGYLRPTPGWFTKEMVVGRIPTHAGLSLRGATARGGRVHLALADHRGAEQDMSADHVVAATGYKLDARRLDFLDRDLLAALNLAGDTPVLSRDFQSSVRGLYFAGPLSSNSFGPPMRFVVGAEFASRRIALHLAEFASRSVAFSPVAVTAR